MHSSTNVSPPSRVAPDSRKRARFPYRGFPIGSFGIKRILTTISDREADKKDDNDRRVPTLRDRFDSSPPKLKPFISGRAAKSACSPSQFSS